MRKRTVITQRLEEEVINLYLKGYSQRKIKLNTFFLNGSMPIHPSPEAIRKIIKKYKEQKHG